MNKIYLDSIRKKIINESKKHILNNGWNENLFKIVSNNSKFKNEEIKALFPNGYLSLLSFYIAELNIQMTENSKKLDLIRMKKHIRIREIILLTLKNYQLEKSLIKRTYFTLMLPQHSKIALKSLYLTVDQMWFIAGDNSTDFNYYSKRTILAAVYSSTVLHWINNENFEETSKFLDRQLKKISKIPKIKNYMKNISGLFPHGLNVIKYFIPSRQ